MRTPVYATISADGGTFGVAYRAERNATGQYLSGYSVDTFRECADTLPALDYRPGDVGKILGVILRTDGVQEIDGRGITARQYAEAMQEAGARLTTVGELRGEAGRS